jgi:hypothetical protein
MYADEMPDRVRLVLAGDRDAVGALEDGDPVLLTRAARQLLGPNAELPSLLPHSPTFSPHTARELLGVIIRLNLEKAAASEHPPVLRGEEPASLDT